VLDPWTWERSVIRELPPESFGQCNSRYIWAWFGPLIGILFLAEGLTMYFAWKTADVPNDFRDSSAVMYASFALLQSWAFGVPIIAVIGNSSSEATYFGRICLIWIFSVSSVVVVVGPKVVSAFRIRRKPSLAQKKDRIHVSGVLCPIGSQEFSCNSLESGHRPSEFTIHISTNF
jgi:hypothetical protein